MFVMPYVNLRGQAFGQAPWGDWYGDFVDRYGVHRMFDIPAAH